MWEAAHEQQVGMTCIGMPTSSPTMAGEQGFAERDHEAKPAAARGQKGQYGDWKRVVGQRLHLGWEVACVV